MSNKVLSYIWIFITIPIVMLLYTILNNKSFKPYPQCTSLTILNSHQIALIESKTLLLCNWDV